MVNEIRNRLLNSRPFKTRRECINLQYEHLYQTQVTWLSRGRLLLCLVELMEETKQLLEKGTLY